MFNLLSYTWKYIPAANFLILDNQTLLYMIYEWKTNTAIKTKTSLHNIL